MAAFGGDPDNYTYPRHNLDFSLFRVYEDGKPYRPEALLPFSAKGVAMGELTFISGHPGVTYRQQTHAQMAYARDTGIPFQLRLPSRRFCRRIGVQFMPMPLWVERFDLLYDAG